MVTKKDFRGSREMELPEGKLPVEVLETILNSLPKRKGSNLIVSPSIGVDVGVTKTAGKYLATSSDPITGAVEQMGWHAVNVSANDVATSGIMPDSLSVVSLFPKGTSPRRISFVISEIGRVASGLGITVTGGHTEITSGVTRPIIVVTCFGSGARFVTASMARANDAILMTKTAGIEGTAILSRLGLLQGKVPRNVLNKGARLIKNLSVVKDAKLAFATGKVHAMHDATEGGILGCLVEMSVASGLGFELEEDLVPVDPATREISRALEIDPLKLIGSGSLIISCLQKDAGQITQKLQSNGITCSRIGTFLPKRKGRRKKFRNGLVERLAELSIQDELWPALRKYG